MTGMGQVFDRQGDAERALSWYEKSLEVQENPAVRRRVQQLRGGN